MCSMTRRGNLSKATRTMPATEQAIQVTDAYRTRLLTIRQRAVAVIRARWSLVNADDLDGTFDAWLTVATATLLAAQRTGVTLSDQYLATFLSAELGRTVPPAGVDPDRFAGQDQAGQPLGKALAASLITAKIAIAQGRNRAEAQAMARNRAVRTTATESLSAPREALGVLMTENDAVKGWRRVTAPGACGACLASADGSIQTDRLKIHRFDRCTSEPVVDGADETVRRPTGREIFDRLSPAQQAALFHGRGGEEKARLIRDGEVPFEALIAPTPLAAEPNGITEAPLQDLAARAA
jgi:hypothetical protein